MGRSAAAMSWSSGQRYLAEFLGTFTLLLSVSGAALLSLNVPVIDPISRVVLISFALGLGVIGAVYAFGDLSGAHFNPAVTIGFWLSGRLKARDVVPYIVAQLLGGILGLAVIAGVAYGSGTLWSSASSGGVALASQGFSGGGSPYTVGLGSVFLLEVVFTFLLVEVALFATRPENFSKNLAPLGIGLTLVMTNLVAIPIDGASINPARSFAPALLSYAFSPDHWALQQDWLFWVAPLVGALIAAGIERLLRPRAG